MKTPARALLAVTALLALTACHGGGAPPDPEAAREVLEENLAPRPVRLVTPEVREERPAVSLVGEVRPFDTVTIASEVAGRVEEVLVEVGDPVAAGQILVRVDRETYRLRLAQAEAELAATRAQLELAGRELERKRDLVSDDTIPRAAFDQATASFDLATARVAAAASSVALARTDFERSEVRAPSPGVVTGRHAVKGMWADVGHGLVELAVGSDVKIAARVPSQWAPYLQGLEGFDFTVREGETPRHAELYAVDPVVEAASRSFEVVGTAPRDGLKPGLFATVTLTSPQVVRSLWIPATGVVASDTPRVMTVETGRVAVLGVQTGRRDDGMVEVTTGLDVGQEIVENVAGLSRGLPVEIVG